MNGKLIGIFLIAAGAIGGAAMYWLQVYAFYERLDDVALVMTEGGVAQPLDVSNLQAIDATSSPIRFRACFDIAGAVAGDVYADAVPLNAPGWFDCFDAEAIGDALASGTAQAYLGQFNVIYGIDRVIAVFPDGRAFAWHQINACGEEVFDGNPPPDGCPPVPEGTE
ncbi:MAG: DUF6446 family protein [Pseudomonadota bacterium]